MVLMDRREKGHRGNTQRLGGGGRRGWGHVCGAVFTDNATERNAVTVS